MTVRPSLLQSILPPFDQFDADYFTYPQLQKVVEAHYYEEYEEVSSLGDGFSPSTIDETVLQDYLPVLALKIQEARTDDERRSWSKLYTEASVALFGRPDIKEAIRMARRDLVTFGKLVRDSPDVADDTVRPLFDMYKRFVGQQPLVAEDSAEKGRGEWNDGALLCDLRFYLQQRYGDIYAVLDQYPADANLDVATVKAAYEEMLRKLAARSPVWRKWKVETPESAQMAVSPRLRVIKVGSRMPLLTVDRAKSLFTHEVLVHAQRSVRGLGYDHYLGYGLPGYVIAEEGLGVLMEAAIEGKMPHRAGDRYIDIALALGSSNMNPVDRHALLPVVRARTILRRLQEGTTVTQEQLHHMVTQHVTRIYRGTLGNEIVGVFTKDVVYYSGYRLMAEYLSRYQGDDLQRAIDFVLSSKINPDDPIHRQYLHDRKFNVIRSM